MVTLTEQERGFVYSIFNDLYQNYASRSIEPVLLASILTKLNSITPNFNEAENRRVQYALQKLSERYNKLADSNIQFILSSNDKGVTKTHDNFFNGPAMYNISRSILAKLEAGP